MNAPDTLLTPDEAAEFLRLPVRHLQTWRYLHTGPAYIKGRAAVRYTSADLSAWLAANRIDPAERPERRRLRGVSSRV